MGLDHYIKNAQILFCFILFVTTDYIKFKEKYQSLCCTIQLYDANDKKARQRE